MTLHKSSPEEHAHRWASKHGCKVLQVFEFGYFLVKCKSCKREREVAVKNGHLLPKCRCEVNRTLNMNAEQVTERMHDKGLTDYTCLEFSGSLSKAKFRHACGNVFSMTTSCFYGCRTPCGKCRPKQNITNAEFLRKAKELRIVPLSKYTDSRVKMRYRYEDCGHTWSKPAGDIFLGRIARCQICSPTGIWREETIQGRKFKVRSKPELAFIKYILDEGASVDMIEYEPKDTKVKWFDSAQNTIRSYTPDFRVGKYLVEVKDLSSLGLRSYNWMDKKTALRESREKFKAASKLYDNYRMYCYVDGEFHRVKSTFWTKH